MHSFVPASLVATATLFSAVQGINILEPAAGETVYASQGFDVVWTYDSSDFTNWEIELANPTPGALLATNVIQPSLASGATSTFTYHVAAFTGVADGDDYHVVMDPRNGGIGSYPESGAFTIVNGASGTTTTSPSPTSSSSSSSSSSSASSSSSTSTSSTLSQTSTTGSTSISSPSSSSSSTLPSTASSSSTSTSGSTTSSASTTSTLPTISVSTGRNSTIVSASTSFSTYVSGTVSSLIPQSTIYKTTVVGPTSTTASSTGTASATSSPTIALAVCGKNVSPLGLAAGVVGAVLGLFTF